MPNATSTKNQPPGKSKLDISFKKSKEKELGRYRYSYIPLSIYWLKDLVRGFIGQKNFPDALAIVFAVFSISIAFPFFPPVILAPLIIATFIITLISPPGGLMAMLFETLLMFIYQAPLLAWILTIFISISLFLGYKHYRTITFIYVLIMLPLSYLGLLIEIPAFIIGSFFLGFRRSVASTVIIIMLVAMLSGMTGVQNSAPIVYNAAAAHQYLQEGNATALLSPSNPAPTLTQFSGDFISAIGKLFSFDVAGFIFKGFGAAILSMSYNFGFTALQVVLWLIVVFAIANYVIRSRSPFKGTEASFLSFFMLGGYIILGYVSGMPPNKLDVISFIITPVIMFLLEVNNVEVVKTLAVMKQDFLGQFGEAFQDLSTGTKETLNDVADYDETKKELREAILAPIEHREITGAYNVRPAKGILLFGPPGTGKTLLMRALSNEIRAKFFYVKTSSLVSPFQGESAQSISKIFNIARKNSPAVLFFDEIDGIASKRESQDSDSDRQMLSTLLTEMDGFQKIEGVVIVGSTNAPNLVDESILRPGRFDKIIYVPLPDKAGRIKILDYYLKKLPIGGDMSYSKLADITNRYSGADIKNVCDEVARQVADDAVKQRKVLQINTVDMVRVIKNTKPSTSLASLERYSQFKLDYERRAHPELQDNREDAVKLDDVIGLADAKKALYEAVEIPILHPSLVKKYDVSNIKGILLFGPPGTGKTMLMKAVANELEDSRLIIMSGSEIAKNGLENALTEIREVFNRARENVPAIIFVDEMDSMLPERSHASELSIHIISEFLQQLDGIKNSNGIVFVGATNRPDKIDQAVLRPGRMDKFIFVPPPNGKDRALLFELNLKKAPLAGDINFEALAAKTEGYTGADISNICRQAKLNALEENVSTTKEKPIDMDGLLAIIRSTRSSAPSSTLGPYMNFISLYGER